MEEEKRIKWISRGGFITSLVIGVLLLWATNCYIHQDVWYEVLKGLAIALITAGVIGGLIEFTFVSRLAKHVFEIAFGHILPSELKDELKWIYNINLLATESTHTFVIEPCSSNPKVVIVHITISRTIENIGNKNETIKAGLRITEPFNPEGYSNIKSYTLTSKDDKQRLSIENGEVKVGRYRNRRGESPTKLPDYMLVASSKKGITLRPHKKCSWVAEYDEYKYINDVTYVFSRVASKNPNIKVKVPEHMNLDYDVTFGYRDQGEVQDKGSGHFQLNGTLLPLQFIRIRWWNKADSEKWKQEIDKKHGKAK